MASSISGQTFSERFSVVAPSLHRKRIAARRTGPLSSSNSAASAPGTALSHVRES